jgi:signal transduction histidine kinase
VNDYPHEGDQLILNIFEDHNKNVWIGSYSGLGLLSKDMHTIKRFQITDDTTEVNDRVNCVFEDSKKRLWIGSYGGLHQMIDEKTFVTYTTKDGLPVNLVHGILEDRHGNLWLGTSHGLCVFNPEAHTFKTYDESDGLASSEFRRKAFFKSEDGQMFVGGRGLNTFYPDSIRSNPNIPPVFITDLKVFNQPIVPNGLDGILKDAMSETREIFLDHEQAFITLHYVGINFTASYKNQYAYMLEGFDDNWNYVGNQRFATFTNLNPGTYTFRVKASNNDGLWNEDGASLIIHVLPPWHQTIWFRAAAIGLIIILIALIYYLRVGNIERQNFKLEELVGLRTRELREKNEQLALREQEIKAQNEMLLQVQEETFSQRDLLADQNKRLEDAHTTIERKNQEILKHNETLEQEVEKRTREIVDHNHQLEQFAFISAHNLRAPVARILGLGEILKFSRDAEEEKMIREKLIHTTQELDMVVKDLNKILEIRKDSTSVISEINLSQELALVRSTLAKEIEDTQARINENFNGVTVLHSVKAYVDSILINLVSNAIKYRNPERTPVIDIAATKGDEFICLSVRDNGLGMDLAKYEDKLFKLYSRFHTHVEGKGMGLYLVKTQVAALGGKIEAIGNEDDGMTFKVFLPSDKAGLSTSHSISLTR